MKYLIVIAVIVTAFYFIGKMQQEDLQACQEKYSLETCLNEVAR